LSETQPRNREIVADRDTFGCASLPKWESDQTGRNEVSAATFRRVILVTFVGDFRDVPLLALLTVHSETLTP
jgi:hypothetical protein